MIDPSVTVVIPAYNREGMVGRAVLSARLQSLEPAEIIVVDDGSSDSTGDAARALGATVIRRENGGIAAARNTGLEAARGDWVAFLDSDDEWLPQHLRTLSAFCNPGVGLVAANARAVPSGRLVGHPQKRPLELDVERLIWPESPLSPSSAVVRRSAAMAVGGFPQVQLGEDRLMWSRLLGSSRGIVAPDVTCLYHEHSTQISGRVVEMAQARDDILRGFLDDNLVSPQTLEKVRIISAWDAGRDTPGLDGVRQTLKVVTDSSAWPALVEQLWYRRRLSKRSSL